MDQNHLINFIAGGLSGVISKTICAPIERVKLLMQTQSTNQQLKKPYTSVYIKIRYNLKLQFYNKLLFCLMLLHLNSILLQNLSSCINQEKICKNYQNRIMKNSNFFIKNCIILKFTILFVKQILDCFSRCIKDEGPLSLWRGNWANVVRYFPTQALNFCLKDSLKSIFNNYDGKKNPVLFLMGNILSGAFAGSITLCFVYPLDFSRTRLAADIGTKSQRQFKGLSDCMKKIFQKEGIYGLYRGFAAGIVGIFFYRGLYFGLYDSGKYFLFKDEKNSSIYQRLVFAQVVVKMYNLFQVVSSECISYPTDTVRRVLMMQSGKQIKEYNGQIDCYQKIYKKDGLKGFFHGNLSNIYRGIGSSLVLVFYDEIQKILNQKNLY